MKTTPISNLKSSAIKSQTLTWTASKKSKTLSMKTTTAPPIKMTAMKSKNKTKLHISSDLSIKTQKNRVMMKIQNLFKLSHMIGPL